MKNNKTLPLILSFTLFAIFHHTPAHAFIVGDYQDAMNFPFVCRLDTSEKPEEMELCSVTFVNHRFATTAKHCVDDILNKHLPLPKVICSANGGRTLMARDVREIRLFDSSFVVRDPSRGQTPEEIRNDIALISLEDKVNPEAFGGDMKLIRLTTSEQETRDLLHSGKCMISGWGRENKDGMPAVEGGEAGVQHTAQVPLKSIVGSAQTIYQIDSLLSSLGSYRLSGWVKGLYAKTKTEPAEIAVLGGISYFADGALYLKAELQMELDAFFHNGAQPGDSGGPLYCLKNENGANIFVQIGINSSIMDNPVTHSVETHSVLLGRPKIQAWLKKSMASMK